MLCISAAYVVVRCLSVSRSCIVSKRLKTPPYLLWNANWKPYPSFGMVPFSVTLSDLEALSKIFNNTMKHRGWSRGLSTSFLLFVQRNIIAIFWQSLSYRWRRLQAYEKSRFSTNLWLYLGNDKQSHSYCKPAIGTRTRSIEWYHFQWPWISLTQISRARH